MTEKFAVILETQYFENYGSVESPCWKAKGNAYTTLVANLTANDLLAKTEFDFWLIDNDMAKEYYMGQFIVPMFMIDECGNFDEFRDDQCQGFTQDFKAVNENVMPGNYLVENWWEGKDVAIRA